MKGLTLLGSTGSIGLSTLDVLRVLTDRYRIVALAAGRNAARLADQILEFRPALAVVETEDARTHLIKRLEASSLPRSQWPELGFGPEALVRTTAAEEVDFVMSAIVGVAGMAATYEAVRCGKTVGLANKETLVAGGDLVMEAAARSGAEMIPVDSEHNGAHQCLRAGRRVEVARLILTASGGPLRQTPVPDLAAVTPRQALNHPTWKMGPRISIDSATLMNKGFEVIEACWLFGFRPEEVQVVIHPQSSVHAMVEYRDGSLVAQASTPDMRMPIQYALTWPDRLPSQVPLIEWDRPRTWEFSPPDHARFPLLGLAYKALEAGGSAGCTLNAADEVAVDAFLHEDLPFLSIAEVVEDTLAAVPVSRPASVADLLEIDRASRVAAQGACRRARSRPTAQSNLRVGIS